VRRCRNLMAKLAGFAKNAAITGWVVVLSLVVSGVALCLALLKAVGILAGLVRRK
jgi:hypothetical protein